MIPLRTYKPLDAIGGKTIEQNVFLLDQFTIDDDKVLLIEIFEKNRQASDTSGGKFGFNQSSFDKRYAPEILITL